MNGVPNEIGIKVAVDAFYIMNQSEMLMLWITTLTALMTLDYLPLMNCYGKLAVKINHLAIRNKVWYARMLHINIMGGKLGQQLQGADVHEKLYNIDRL